jgi:hypothetical protein
MAGMERLGLVKKNLASRWASPPLILPKAGLGKFRFTLDLRYPNLQAEQVAWSMPNKEDELASLAGSKHFTGSDARILAATSPRGLTRVPVYHHS